MVFHKVIHVEVVEILTIKMLINLLTAPTTNTTKNKILIITSEVA